MPLLLKQAKFPVVKKACKFIAYYLFILIKRIENIKTELIPVSFAQVGPYKRVKQMKYILITAFLKGWCDFFFFFSKEGLSRPVTRVCIVD